MFGDSEKFEGWEQTDEGTWEFNIIDEYWKEATVTVEVTDGSWTWLFWQVDDGKNTYVSGEAQDLDDAQLQAELAYRGMVRNADAAVS